MIKNRKKEFYFQWHITERCNLRCSHCYQNSYSSPDLEENDIMRIFNEICLTLSRWGCDGCISLTGGEPFLRKGILYRLLDCIEDSAQLKWVAILTNGTLIESEDVIRLKEYTKLREIQLSIEGGEEVVNDSIRGKGTFKKILDTVKLLKDENFFVSFMFTLQKRNKGQISSLLDLARDSKIDALKIERITPRKIDLESSYIEPLELKEIYHYIYSMKKKFRNRLNIRTSRPLWVLVDEEEGGLCPIGFNGLTIMHDGTIYPCRRLPIKIGNIFEDTLFKIWYTSPLLWNMRDKNKFKGKCKSCIYFAKCRGCRAVAYVVYGDCLYEDPQCWLERKCNLRKDE